MDKEGNTFYVKDISQDLHTQFGFFKSKDLKKNKGTIKTSTKKEFSIFPPTFVDKFKKLKRGAQIITLKDAGIILMESGITSESKVVEAGGGSGALTCVLGSHAKQVFTYETRKEFVKIINYNVEAFGLENVKVKHKDITKGIAEKNVDVIILDMPDPSAVIEHASKALKAGGFLVLYLPSMTQVISIADKINKRSDFLSVKFIENMQREWKIEGKIARPEFRMLGHTGFLSFFRKV